MLTHGITPRTRLGDGKRLTLIVRLKGLPMKTLFITLIATIALTHTPHAASWMWFHGDIGLSSPFAPSSSPANNAATGVVPKRKAATIQSASR
jgi:hypothetical protein